MHVNLKMYIETVTFCDVFAIDKVRLRILLCMLGQRDVISVKPLLRIMQCSRGICCYVIDCWQV